MISNVSQIQSNNYNRQNACCFKQSITPKYLSDVTKYAKRKNQSDKYIRYIGATALSGVTALIYNLYNNIGEKQKFKSHFTRYSLVKDKTVLKRMTDDIYKANKKYDLHIDYGSIECLTTRNKYIIVRSVNRITGEFIVLYFDNKTGELIKFNKKLKLGDIKNKLIVTSLPTDFKEIDWSTFDKETLLNGNVTEYRDLDCNLISATEFRRSQIDGDFEVYEYDSKGKRYTVGLSEFDKNKGKHIEKHFVSLDHTKTDYIYTDDVKGNRYLYYKITDKDGNILSEIKDKFKVIDDNHFISTINEISYDIQFTSDKIIINKLDKQGNKTKNKIIYKIKEYTKEDYERNLKIIKSRFNSLFGVFNNLKEAYYENHLIDRHTVDKALIPTLKKLSGAEWFALDKNGTENIRKYTYSNDNGWAMQGVIELGENAMNHFSVLEHEIGHETLRYLLKDEKLKNIYEQEKALIQRHLPDIELEQMNYFLKNVDSNGFFETLAEINNIIHTANSSSQLGSREMYLMKYFPKTFAYVMNSVNNSV